MFSCLPKSGNKVINHPKKQKYFNTFNTISTHIQQHFAQALRIHIFPSSPTCFLFHNHLHVYMAIYCQAYIYSFIKFEQFYNCLKIAIENSMRVNIKAIVPKNDVFMTNSMAVAAFKKRSSYFA